MLQETHYTAPVFGLVGDTLTFFGGLILAIDAALQEKRFKRIRNKVKAYTSPEFAQLRIVVEEDGILIRDEKDIEWSFIRHSARWATVGTVLLTLGFGFLILTRFLEISAVCR